MDRHLNLIKDGAGKTEKRVFPRFPFSYLVFRQAGANTKSYEVKDISFTGMQISLKDGESEFKVTDLIEGEIHWYSEVVKIKGEVKRVEDNNIGIVLKGVGKGILI
eukprot:TRINITY_DN10973_c0_g1_i1.p1 TRINITY_DN10973_c0_g1~~TRINITY_DN10973_c0_g1_i1.p1  ORF type:complete len:106 (-),score=6.69 TRINITY_DN10973_c0_g1_i1:132-449(-)